MAYDAALSRAWLDIESVTQDRIFSVKFLSDEYSIDLEGKKVLSLSCNVPAKDYLSIIILHYLIKKIKGLPAITNDWISFQQLAGGQGYFPAFKKRVIDVITRKYGLKPENIFKLIERFKARKAQLADASIVIETFENVPILITLSKADEEFGPEANVLFDRNIADVFCTEDIVILSEFLAHNI